MQPTAAAVSCGTVALVSLQDAISLREEESRGGRVWRQASTEPLGFRVPLRASPAQILGRSAVLGARTATTHRHWAHLTAAAQRKHVH